VFSLFTSVSFFTISINSFCRTKHRVQARNIPSQFRPSVCMPVSVSHSWAYCQKG